MGRVELRDKEHWFALALLLPQGHRSYGFRLGEAGGSVPAPHRTASGIYDKLHL